MSILPRHQQPWHWLCEKSSFVSMRKDLKVLYLLIVNWWYKVQIHIIISSNQFGTQRGKFTKVITVSVNLKILSQVRWMFLSMIHYWHVCFFSYEMWTYKNYHWRQGPIAHPSSMAWLVMTWLQRESGHHQPWFLHSLTGMFQFQHQ